MLSIHALYSRSLVTLSTHPLYSPSLFTLSIHALRGLSAQEPVNAVYYKDYDDQYSAHCDGECAGGRYQEGRRIATSLTYCEVAVRGGDTLFTRSGLKVSPQPGQMLFFGYKMFDQHGKPRMDTGQTEHTGCPLREGRKWIATMWFREGVNATRDWSTFKA